MRRVILSTMLVAGLAACDDGTADNPADAGTDPDVGADMRAPDAPFNYIPLNDEACVVEAMPPGVQQIAGESLNGLVAAGEHRIAMGLKLCDEEPIPGCDITCTGDDNPLMQLATDFDGPLPDVVVEAAAFDVPMGLGAFFEQALSWPYRELVVSTIECADLPPGSCPAGADVQVVLTQGRQQRCDGETAGCDLYSVEPQSLDLSCERFPLTLYGARDGDAAGAYTVDAALPPEALADGVTFGLEVPLVTDFPAAGATLPEDELLAWLDRLEAAQRTLKLRVQNYSMEFRVAADGTVCGRASGRVPVATFVEALQIEDPDRISLVEGVFSPYAAADDPDFIDAQFAFALAPVRLTSGMPCHPDPCVTAEQACDGDTLMTTTTRDRCWLEADAGAALDQPLEASCVERGEGRIVEWSIDCAALGATCSADAGCGVDYRAPAAGELVFTELFIGDGVQQAEDQWVELYNASDAVLDLDGCVLRAGPIQSPQLAVLQPAGPVAVGPGGRIVLASSADPAVSGVSAAFAYGGSLGLGRAMGGDRIALYCGENVLVDEVLWADGWGINEDAASMQLGGGVLDAAGNDDVAAWCASAGDPFAEGRLGTPGAANAACP